MASSITSLSQVVWNVMQLIVMGVWVVVFRVPFRSFGSRRVVIANLSMSWRRLLKPASACHSAGIYIPHKNKFDMYYAYPWYKWSTILITFYVYTWHNVINKIIFHSELHVLPKVIPIFPTPLQFPPNSMKISEHLRPATPFSVGITSLK